MRQAQQTTLEEEAVGRHFLFRSGLPTPTLTKASAPPKSKERPRLLTSKQWNLYREGREDNALFHESRPCYNFLKRCLRWCVKLTVSHSHTFWQNSRRGPFSQLMLNSANCPLYCHCFFLFLFFIFIALQHLLNQSISILQALFGIKTFSWQGHARLNEQRGQYRLVNRKRNEN